MIITILKGGHFIRQLGNLGKALEHAYPEKKWNLRKISSNKKKKVLQRFFLFFFILFYSFIPFF